MAFCRNCGNEVPEGTKFCSNCGASVEINTIENGQSGSQSGTSYAPEEYAQSTVLPAEEPVSMLDKFGRFYGIILLILAFVDLQTDPAFITILLSVAIITGCIFCFSKKYKLKGFTIVAMILAVFCLLNGVRQARRIGLFKMPGSSSTIEESYDDDIDDDIDEMAELDSKIERQIAQAIETPAMSEVKETEESVTSEEIVSEETVTEEKEKVNGVDPDLKEFLDSYEAFMDEYVVFMKKYKDDPGNAISMLSEYAVIMEKYTDFAEKIDKYDSNEMSTEDAKYYLEVINRCNQKMLEVY